MILFQGFKNSKEILEKSQRVTNKHYFLTLYIYNLLFLGINNFMKDIEMMLGTKPFPVVWWKAMWMVITPLLIVVSTQNTVNQQIFACY